MKERHKRIYDIVNALGSASVDTLTKEVFASEATIRRDLAFLEKQGLVTRVWGGAVSASKACSDPPLFIRSNSNINAKRKIAKTATRFLKDNVSVFLPSGTTVTRLAQLMHLYKNLTVITTGLDIIDTLKNHTSITLIVPGGELYESSDIAGATAVENISSYNADLFFFSCSGLTENGFTSNDAARLNIIKAMHKNSKMTVLLADTSKVGAQYIYNGFGFDAIDYVVFEKEPDNKALIKALGDKLTV